METQIQIFRLELALHYENVKPELVNGLNLMKKYNEPSVFKAINRLCDSEEKSFLLLQDVEGNWLLKKDNMLIKNFKIKISYNK